MKTQILAAAFAVLASGVGAAQSPAPAPAASPDYTITAVYNVSLLGLSVGQHIDWPMPGGRNLRLKVTGIQYQPEAAGDIRA